ncbi:MAG: alpha/beta hydrolase [Planctomycetaceae bacterium]|nr:alpha/beta hydrolase [Planctomycetaceae bacterium]
MPPVAFGQAGKSTKSASGAWPPAIVGDKHVYKKVGERELCLWRISPEASASASEGRASVKLPCIVFFFGGGWTSGSPEQFLPQARYLASRGMAAFVADYRVASRDKVKAAACVEDAKSAVRYLRVNAEQLQIDPDRICAAGGSAGGHIACATALLPGFEVASEKTDVSSAPNALALFNPAVVLAPVSGLPIPQDAESKLESLRERLGAEPESMSPVHHVRAGLPPAIIFHGRADTTVNVKTVEKFAELMQKDGNRCELKLYDGAPHGFFNAPNNAQARAKAADGAQRADVSSDEKTKKAQGKKGNGSDAGKLQQQKLVWHAQTLQELDKFLASLGWISGPPTLTIPDSK